MARLGRIKATYEQHEGREESQDGCPPSTLSRNDVCAKLKQLRQKQHGMSHWQAVEVRVSVGYYCHQV